MVRIASVKQLYKEDQLNDNKAASDSSEDLFRQKTTPMIRLNGLIHGEVFEPNLTLQNKTSDQRPQTQQIKMRQKENQNNSVSDDQKEEETPRSNLRRPLTSATTMTQPAEVIG